MNYVVRTCMYMTCVSSSVGFQIGDSAQPFLLLVQCLNQTDATEWVADIQRLIDVLHREKNKVGINSCCCRVVLWVSAGMHTCCPCVEVVCGGHQ